MTRRAIAIVPVALAAVLGTCAIVSLHDASAQRFDPRRPASWVVGAPLGPAPMQRVDARRSGLSKTALPTGTLRVAWKKMTAQGLDQPALSGPDGVAVVTRRGDVVFLDESGEERQDVRVGAGDAGPAAMTSDGSVVYVSGGGKVVRVHPSSTAPRSTHIGGDRSPLAAPLPLDDGGVVVATTTDLVLVDAEGNIRSRVTLKESPAAPLLAAGDKILAIGASGAVFGWTPAHEPVQLGSFGGRIDGGAALRDGDTLVAVVDGNHLAEVEIGHGGLSTRAVAPQGLYLGPPAIRSGPKDASFATVLGITQTGDFVVTLDAAGQELLRAPVASMTPTPLPDGGLPVLVSRPHVGVLVDSRGATAFASTDGHVGVVSPEGSVETLGELVCTNARAARSTVTGLTPLAPGSFAVTCESGGVIAIAGAASSPPRSPAPFSSGGASSSAPPAPPAPPASRDAGSERLRPRPEDR